MAICLLSRVPLRVVAQGSSVVCLSQFNWMNNSMNQNPCVVATYALAVCNGGGLTIGPLPPDTHYTGPSADKANACECSSVVYCLLAACSICQNASYITWTSWTLACSTIYSGYPENILIGTAIPHWAYQDLTASANFNVTLAQSVGDAPESTATKAQVTATGFSSATASASLTAFPSGASSPTSSKSSNVGAIAGGVVASVVVLGAIAVLSTWFFLRRRRKTPSATQPSQQGQPDGVNPTTFRLYNPSDPSTFPTSRPPHSGASFPATTVIHDNSYINNGGGYHSGSEL